MTPPTPGTPGSAPATGASPGSGPILVVLGIIVLFLLAGHVEAEHDPLAAARERPRADENFEASVPPMCYTKTGGVSNPCWTCHVEPAAPNQRIDWPLQESYAFSDTALTNRWSNLFVDRSAAIAGTSDGGILAYIRRDNYAALRRAMARAPSSYLGFRPDLDFDQGFDEDGFARDGSGWRAFRFKPFAGTFWPTNGSSSDAFIRLPGSFRPDRETYRRNLKILETAMSAPGPVELPKRYLGANVPVQRLLYPEGTEFLHTVRYLDLDAPGLLSARMKEVRYSRKAKMPDLWAISRAYEKENDEKQFAKLPWYAGAPESGFYNKFGWVYQGFIEDADGRLRLQTREEHRFCMGCHNGIGVTADSSFAFPRKLPDRAGWTTQDLRGMKDAPQRGHTEPEVLTYFRRVGAGDELRANAEILERYFPGGKLDEARVRAAKDLAELLVPSRGRAMALNKAYRLVVREQSFVKGRDAMLKPAANVHTSVENGARAVESVFKDGSIWLEWR